MMPEEGATSGSVTKQIKPYRPYRSGKAGWIRTTAPRDRRSCDGWGQDLLVLYRVAQKSHVLQRLSRNAPLPDFCYGFV